MPRVSTNAIIPARRFTDKPHLEPQSVWSLPNGHAALTENRTLFPTTVVDVDENFEDRLLVSGRNNRKLGEIVAKGKYKGFALYGLSLEERATCPADCSARAYCYGNSMQMARRHRIIDLEFFALCLEEEIREHTNAEERGVLVRLHVLGDFPSVEYVKIWRNLLRNYPKLSCYGYTHWAQDTEIGTAIRTLKERYYERFRIRWSRDKIAPDSAVIINEIPDGPRHNGMLVCPAQTDATGCCASCGLCWEPTARNETIAFIKHGRKMDSVGAMALNGNGDKMRHIAPIKLPSNLKTPDIISPAPIPKTVAPASLLIESDYQRDLSGKSLKLIKKILRHWDWAKFKPPICVETARGLFVVDGQHTAIAAASHPAISEIPVMIVSAKSLPERAAAFVSHNRDRLAMTPAQIFYGDLAAKDSYACLAMEICIKSGARVPRLPVAKGQWKQGQISAVGELRDLCKKRTSDIAERVLTIAVKSKIAPLNKTLLRALAVLLTDSTFETVRAKTDEQIAEAIASIEKLEEKAHIRGIEGGWGRFYACAELIAEALR